jgi:probable rRNA maturation factor
MIDVDGANPELCEVVRQTLIAEGVSSGRVDMHFVDSEEMTALNSEHMGGSGPTDVLSFPIDGIDGQESDPGGRHIGEIVICMDVADSQAGDHMGDVQSELTLLSIHATLHLCGFDHHDPIERAEMWAKEAVHLRRYELTHPGDQQ